MPNLPPIKIHTHPEPIIVAYKNIRETIPKLLFPESPEDGSADPTTSQQSNHPHAKGKLHTSKPNFDVVLHIGMAPGRKFFTLETCAHRDGYNRPDVDDETLEHDTFWQQEYDAPKTLHPDFDTDDVWRKWKTALMVRTSPPSHENKFIYSPTLDLLTQASILIARRHPHLQRRGLLPVRFYLLRLPGRVLASRPPRPAARHVPARAGRARRSRHCDREGSRARLDRGASRESREEMR